MSSVCSSPRRLVANGPNEEARGNGGRGWRAKAEAILLQAPMYWIACRATPCTGKNEGGGEGQLKPKICSPLCLKGLSRPLLLMLSRICLERGRSCPQLQHLCVWPANHSPRGMHAEPFCLPVAHCASCATAFSPPLSPSLSVATRISMSYATSSPPLTWSKLLVSSKTGRGLSPSDPLSSSARYLSSVNADSLTLSVVGGSLEAHRESAQIS